MEFKNKKEELDLQTFFGRSPSPVSSSQLFMENSFADSARLAKHWLTMDLDEDLFKNLEGQTLVDVGCGMISGGSAMPEMAKKFGCMHYVGIDKDQMGAGNDLNPFRDVADSQSKEVADPMDFILIQAEMFDALSRIQDGTACITINGVDKTYLTKEGEATLVSEILRICPVGGLIFGIGSEVTERLMKNPACKILYKQNYGVTITVLQKIQTDAVSMQTAHTKTRIRSEAELEG